MSAVIEIRGLGKRYRKLEEHRGMLRSIVPFFRPPSGTVWALRDFDLTVTRGEVVGVLGHNGAGKTTLLRLLAGVTQPSEGHLRVRGRIAPLISLGVGFHPEMSGRENVLVNGMLLGLSAREITERFDSIVEFAELEEFIDTPVKFYSSGMSMRLGFSVVIHVDPSVLLVDEILAVGDASFQLKCFDRLRDFQQQGAAIVMVSHSMHQVRQLCPRAILISHGRLVYDGDVERAIALHYESISELDGESAPGMGVEVLERRLAGGEGEDHHANYDQPMELAVRLRFHLPVESPTAHFTVHTDGGLPVTESASPLDPRRSRFEAGEEVTLSFRFRARLGGGSYRLGVYFCDHQGSVVGGCDDLMLFVAARPGSVGVIDLRARIEVDGADRSDWRLSLLGH